MSVPSVRQRVIQVVSQDIRASVSTYILHRLYGRSLVHVRYTTICGISGRTFKCSRINLVEPLNIITKTGGWVA